jgi:hypothetical protein
MPRIKLVYQKFMRQTFRMGKRNLLVILAVLSAFALIGCSHDESSDSTPMATADPTVLIDTYEREISMNCDGSVNSDQLQRRAAVNSIKINPDQNVYIASASFFNLDNADEFTPKNVWIPGPGGDNLKWVSFCQEPKPVDASCGLAVHAGDNKIEYKYWSHENPDTMAEDKVRVMHFSVSSQTSSKVCTRTPDTCPSTTPTWGACKY